MPELWQIKNVFKDMVHEAFEAYEDDGDDGVGQITYEMFLHEVRPQARSNACDKRQATSDKRQASRVQGQTPSAKRQTPVHRDARQHLGRTTRRPRISVVAPEAPLIRAARSRGRHSQATLRALRCVWTCPGHF